MKLLLLNREEELVSIISETTSDPIYDEVLNGKDTFEFEVSEYSVEKGYRVLFQDVNSDWREYIVTGIEEKHNRNGLRKKIYCESSYYELLGDWLADIRPNNRTARYALEQALSTSRWEVGIVDDLGLNSTNYYRTDAKTAVEKVAEVWGGEIKTRIEVIGNKVTGRFVDLYRNRGTDSGKRFTYTKDIEEVTREVSEDLIITALHGFGKSEEIGDGFGRRIDFSSINNGKSYLENNSARLMYGRNNSDGTKSHVFGKVEFDDIEDIELLKTEAQKVLDALSIPSVLYKVQVQDLSVFGYEHEKVNLGDYVLTADKEFIPELRFKARVVGIKRNLANELETEITIGNVLESYTSKMNSQSNALNDIRDRIGVLDKIADGSYQLPRADGQGYNYYGSVAPSNPHNGDIWFKPNGEYQEMWQYVDGQWTLLLDTSVSEQLKQEVDAAIAKAEAAQQAAEQSFADAVTEAERLVEEQSEAFDAQLSDVTQEINTVKSNIDTAISNVNQEIANNFTSLSDSISDVNSIANQAKADAQTGITNAATALSQAQSAISQLGGLSGKITSVENDIDDINGVLSTKVSTTEFNLLTGTVTNLSTTQTQQAGLIAQKANQSTVDTLSGRVTTAEGQISTQAGQIALRVTEVQAKSIADSAVDGISTGRRNLVLKSGVARTSTAYNIANYDLSEEWVRGEEYVIVVKANYIEGKYLGAYANVGTLHIVNLIYDTNLGVYIGKCIYAETHSQVTKRLSIFQFPNNAAQMNIEWVSVIKGNVAYNDWVAAPEETIELISSVSTELSIEKDNITALLTRTNNNETVINQVKSTADGTKQTVANHAGRLTTVETNVNGLQTIVSDPNTGLTSKYTQLANGFSTVVNSLESGGRNLLKDIPYTYKFPVTTGTYDNKLIYEGLERNTTYTFSSKVIDTTGNNRNTIVIFPFLRNGQSMDYTTMTITNGRVKGTFTTDGRYDYNLLLYNGVPGYTQGNSFEFTEMQLEKGTIAQPYSYPIESIAIQSQITQLSNQIDLAVTNGDVIGRINVQAGVTLISNKKLLLDANTYIMGTTFANDVKAKSLEAITANITSIRSQILQSNVVEANHLKADTAMINKLFATTALIETLTSKTAFINSIKAIDISADKITSGTLNSAIVNAISLNVSQLVGNISNFIQSNWNLLDATTSITGTGLVSQKGILSTRLTGGEIATVSGTKTGKINALGMEIYDSANGQTTKLYSDGIEYNWYSIKRVIEQNSEGLTIRPITGSGNRLNSSLHITTGPGVDKVAYVEFTNPTSGYGGRIILDGLDMGIRHPAGGVVQIANYANDGRAGNLRAGTFQTSTYDGRGLRIVETQINTLADNQTIYMIPSGTGEFRIGTGGNTPLLWPVRASRFVEGSSRASKTNIRPYVGNALDEINRLQAVTFNRQEDLVNGINYMSLGFIAEDSPSIAIKQPDAPLGVDHYKMVTLAIKGIQELDRNVINLADRVNVMDHRFLDEINSVRITANNALTKTQELEKRIEELEEEIKLLKCA